MNTNDSLGVLIPYVLLQGTMILLCCCSVFLYIFSARCMEFAWLSRAMNRFGLDSSASCALRKEISGGMFFGRAP
jgi:hypothetical protein